MRTRQKKKVATAARNDRPAAAPTPAGGAPASEADIRLRAYLKWESTGRPPGDGVSFWLEAEQELTNGE